MKPTTHDLAHTLLAQPAREISAADPVRAQAIETALRELIRRSRAFRGDWDSIVPTDLVSTARHLLES